VDNNPTQVLLVLIVMFVQFVYLAILRPLSSPLKMLVELFSAACECITVFLVGWCTLEPVLKAPGLVEGGNFMGKSA
jgi:hypothetical protein